MLNFKSLINGELVESTSHQTLEIIAADNLQPFARVPALTRQDIDRAFTCADHSHKKWKNVLLSDRIAFVEKYKTLLFAHRFELVDLMTHEIAKAHKDAMAEVLRTIDYITYAIEECKRLYPEAYEGEPFGIKNKIGLFKRVPRGVVLAIAPFNYPVNLSNSKIIPALLAGNSVVFKPATNGSAVGCFLGQLFLRAHFPPGVINVVTGRGRDIGNYLVTNNKISLISFTGSATTGQNIKNIARGVDLVLELGGKDPILVLDDADLDKAATTIVEGGLAYSGQRCTAIKLVLVDDKVADHLVAKVKQKIEQLPVGSPHDDAFITPLISDGAATFVESLVRDAQEKGATVLTGGTRQANLFAPTLIDHIRFDMKLAGTEPFGPVLPVIRCHSQADLIKAANHSRFGLQAAIFTTNINRAFAISDMLEVGTVNINGKTQRGPDSFPFLGVKQSGRGVQGIRETFLSVTRLKGIVINY